MRARKLWLLWQLLQGGLSPAAVPGLLGEDVRPVRELQRQPGGRLPDARGPGGAPGGALRKLLEAACGLRGPAEAAQRPLQPQPALEYVRPGLGAPGAPSSLGFQCIPWTVRPPLGEVGLCFHHQHLMIFIWIIYSSKSLY